MLRIRVDDQPWAATFYVEGKLIGSSVEELRKVWTATRGQDPQKPTIVDLSSVLVLDTPARNLLRQMHSNGAQLAGNGIMIKTLIKDIADGKVNPGESGLLLISES